MDFYAVMNFSVKMFYSSGLTFIYCEVGEQLSNSFGDLADAFNQCEYESFPIELQRLMPIVLAAVQHPPILRSYGNITCCRNTFKQVCKLNTNY